MPSAAAALDSSSPASWLTPPSSAYAALGGATDTPPPDTTKKAKDDDKSAKPDTSPQVKVDFAPGAGAGMGSREALEAIGRLEQERSNYQPPKLERPKPPDSASKFQDVQLWGSLAIAFGALASLRTRTPLTTALNSAAAAMNGMNQGQQQIFEQNFEKWQADTKYALENFNYEQRIYEDVMDNISRKENFALNAWGKLDAEDEMKFKMTTDTLKDAPAWAAYEQGGFGAVVDLKNKQAEAVKNLKGQTGNVILGAKMQILQSTPEWKDLQKKAAAGDEDAAEQMQTKIDEVAAEANADKAAPPKRLLTDPADIHETALAIYKGDEPPLTGRGNTRGLTPADQDSRDEGGPHDCQERR